MTTSQSAGNVIIRWRVEADIIKCVEVLEDVHAFDAYPGNWPREPSRWLTPNGFLRAWVAEADSLIVGHVVAGAIDEEADPHFTRVSCRRASELVEIKRLFVAPVARGHGIGRRLIDAVVKYAHSNSLDPILEVTAERQATVQFYERCGWLRIGATEATWQRTSGQRPLLYQYQLHPKSTFGGRL